VNAGPALLDHQAETQLNIDKVKKAVLKYAQTEDEDYDLHSSSGVLSPLTAATLGGLLTTWVTFIPCELVVLSS
jgi:hypothetical protein